MRLLELRSSNKNFKTIRFKKGLNIIAGIKLSDDGGDSYNGVGKSFSLNLIHLMFGATLRNKSKKEQSIKKFLSTYGTFYLSFIHNEKRYEISKNFGEASFYLNGEKIFSKDYPSELSKVFLGDTFSKQVSFKRVFNAFARRDGSNYYSDAITQQGQPKNDYYQMYINFILLKINTYLVEQKKVIKDELNAVKDALKAVENSKPTETKISLSELKRKLEKIKKEKENFNIGQNFQQLEVEANELTVEINQFRNRLFRANGEISRKQELLEQLNTPEENLDKLEELYKEIGFFFREEIIEDLAAVSGFHKKLMLSRENRISGEIEELNSLVSSLNESINGLTFQRDRLLESLSSNGALEEYDSLNNAMRMIESDIHQIEKYAEVINDLQDREHTLNHENTKVKARGHEYLNNLKGYKEKIESSFNELAKKFYRDVSSSLNVSLAKDAKYLYDIDVYIPRDGSHGVNEVKIFCYDFLLYQLNRKLLNFVAHDGSIFSEMDPRQKATIFKVAIEFINKDPEFQYLVNIGQSSLEEVLEQDDLTSLDKENIENSIILKLYDKDPSQWLFGESFG